MSGTKAQKTSRRSDRSSPVAVVTGASAGIGRAMVIEFARCGYDVALLARGTELLHDGSTVHLTMVPLPGVNTQQLDWSRTHQAYHCQPVSPWLGRSGR